MKSRILYVLILVADNWCGGAQAQLQILPDATLQKVFAGEARNVAVIYSNSGDTLVEARLSMQLYQASSATAAVMGKPVDWKKIRALPAQTVLDFAEMDFPAVTAATKFIVQWQSDAGRVLGTTKVMVYPSNLLASLAPLTGRAGLGVLDPQDQLKPSLKGQHLEFEDLADKGLGHFPGRLVIIGSFPSSAPARQRLAGQIKELLQNNIGVVWVQPLPEKMDKPVPSFYSVIEKTNAAVIVQAEMVAGLAERPQAQLNLVYFCQLALNPESLRLPDLAFEP